MEAAPEIAIEHDALLAQHRGKGGYSLSPASFDKMPYVERVVLPSPNGSTLTLLASDSSLVLCGCLRNASVVAETARKYKKIGVVPAGEKWPDGSLRPALEDWMGAGAIISNLPGSWSPEATAAISAFEASKGDLPQALRTCPSGVELLDDGYGEDVELAGQLDSSKAVPQFYPPAYHG